MKKMPFCLSLLLALSIPSFLSAEVVVDNSLGKSSLILSGPDYGIFPQYGAQQGDNLFYSFQTFNLQAGENAVFVGPDSIRNIISRVTGGRPSTLDGGLYVQVPQADFYFLNPAGILFGPNAVLSVPASVYFSSADYLRIGEDARFNADVNQASTFSSAPPTAFGFLDGNSGNLEMNGSVLSAVNQTRYAALMSGQPLGERNTFALVGGDVTLTDSVVESYGDDIAVVSAAGAGEVLLENGLQLNAPGGRITLRDSGATKNSGFANLDSSGLGGGKIVIKGGGLLLDNAWVFADTQGNRNGQGVEIDIKGDMRLGNLSRITTEVYQNPNLAGEVSGQGGNIEIQTDNLAVLGGSQIASASREGTSGSAGDVTVQAAHTVSVSGTALDRVFTGSIIDSSIASNTISEGDGGNITVNARTLLINDGASIKADTRGAQGNSGEVNIQTENLTLTRGGNINISAGNQGNFQTNPASLGFTGNAGDLNITADAGVQITGTGGVFTETIKETGLFSNVFTQGQGGTIRVTTPRLTLSQQGTIQAGTQAGGPGGKIVLNTPQLSVGSGAEITTKTLAQGAGGTLQIAAGDIYLDTGTLSSLSAGSGAAGQVQIQTTRLEAARDSRITAQAQSGGAGGTLEISASETVNASGYSQITAATSGSGAGGAIVVNTPQLRVSNGGAISTDTYNGGRGGSLAIRSTDIRLDQGRISSLSLGRGDAGQVEIQTARLEAVQDSRITAQTQSSGAGGSIHIAGSETVTVSGDSQISAATAGSGAGGVIRVDSPQLNVNSGAAITTDTRADGAGGSLIITADGIYLDRGVLSTLAAGSGDAGDLQLDTKRLQADADSRISAETRRAGRGGTLTLSVTEALTLSGDSQITAATAGSGNGGAITLNTPSLILDSGAAVTAATSGSGNGGTLQIIATDIRLSDGILSSLAAGAGDAGHVRIDTARLEAGQGSAVTAETRAGGRGGTLEIDASEALTLSEESRITAAAAGSGNGGEIRLNTPQLMVNSGASINTDTTGQGTGGILNIDAAEIRLAGGFLSSLAAGEGDAGSLKVRTARLAATGDSRLTAETRAGGAGGTIDLDSSEALTLSGGSQITAAAAGSGSGGHVILKAVTLTLENAAIQASTTGSGDAGYITLSADTLTLDNATIQAATRSSGAGNDIDLESTQLNLRNHSAISAESTGSGNAGTLRVATVNSTVMRDSDIKTATDGAQGGDISFKLSDPQARLTMQNSDVTTSVKAADGDGGEIEMAARFIFMERSKIIAQAVSGDGGNIDITTKHIFAYEPQSLSTIDASSRFGTSGVVTISAPDTDLNKELLVFNEGLLDVSDQVLPPCDAETVQTSAMRASAHRVGVPDGVDDWQGGFLKTANPQMKQGRFTRAVATWSAALPDAAPLEQIDLRRNLAAAYQQLAMHREVLITLDAALQTAKTVGDTRRQALVLSQLSDAWLTLGDWEAAKNFVEEALELARTDNHPHTLAQVINSEGNMLVAVLYYPEALEAYQEAAKFAAQSDDAELQIAIGLNRLFADLDAHGGDPALLESVWQQVQDLPDSYLKARSLLSLGVFLESFLSQNLEENQQAPSPALIQRLGQAYRQAGQMAENLGDMRHASLAYGRWGYWYQLEGRHQEALVLMRKAIFFAGQGYNPDILYQWQRRLGQLLALENQPEQAIQAYLRAIDVLQPIQHFLTTGYRRPVASFETAVRPVYYELADLLLRKAARLPDAAAQQAMLLNVRNRLERLKAAELQNVLQDECIAKYETPPTVLDQVLEQAALIYPVPLENRLVLLVSRADGIQQLEVDVSREALSSAAIELQSLLQTRLHSRFRTPAKDLYNWLIRPAEPLLQGAETLVIVPDGHLRLLPMGTLYDGEQYLVEKYALATAPGVTLFDPRPLNWDSSQVLLAGLSESVQEYPPLPSVPTEVETIQKIVGGGTRIMNQDYVLSRLENELRQTPYSIVHLATHGEFDRNPDYTYLLTYESKMHMDKLQAVLGVGRYREQPIELLTLSACKTAVGDDRAALGLAGVAIKAGARSALASLWFVDDEATYKTITEFYRQLRGEGVSKAKALQVAQTKMLRQKHYAHPIYWAPFILIGNWL